MNQPLIAGPTCLHFNVLCFHRFTVSSHYYIYINKQHTQSLEIVKMCCASPAAKTTPAVNKYMKYSTNRQQIFDFTLLL